MRARKAATVLLAEPDADTRALYRAAFTQAGWQCTEATDGREALVYALTQKPSLCVAESRLPLIDGVALCRELRADAETAALRIVIITADARPDHLAALSFAGANAVLTKPVAVDTILETAQRLITDSLDNPPSSTLMRGEATLESGARVAIQQPTGPASNARRRDTIARFTTTTPTEPTPKLTCPGCDRPLVYRATHYGGVNAKAAERWDEFACEDGCGGRFEYRFRTRRLRRI